VQTADNNDQNGASRRKRSQAENGHCNTTAVFYGVTRTRAQGNKKSAAARLTSDSERQQGVAAYQAYTESLKKAEALVGANRLQHTNTATTVRLVDGKPQKTKPSRKRALQHDRGI